MLPHADLIFQATVVAHPGHHKSRILQMMVELEGGGHFFVDFPPFGYGPANLSQFATRASNGAGTGGWRRIIISRSSTSTVARFSMSRSAASRGWRGSVGALRVGVRDRWIGWTDAQRLSPDLQNRHGDPALLAKTFVDGARFSGTCDRAANGWCLGSTAGFSRMQGEVSDSPHHDFIDQLKKAIYYIVDPEKSQIQRSRSEYAGIYSLKVWIPMAGSGLMDALFLAISEDHLRPRPCAGTESHDRFRNRLEKRLDRRHAQFGFAWPGSWTGPDATRPSVCGTAPTVVVPAGIRRWPGTRVPVPRHPVDPGRSGPARREDHRQCQEAAHHPGQPLLACLKGDPGRAGCPDGPGPCAPCRD